ncbi:MAG: formate hydrogenlyase [Oscillospiraceae bacterium]|nr:formate hydrogenlyase [Oscillospiraceae bacterium]
MKKKQTSPKNTLNHDRAFERKAHRLYGAAACFVLVLTAMIAPAYAAGGGDPLTVVTNLSNFIFSLIRAVGMILLGFGVLQVGMSLKSHDPSQRANGIMTVAGGIVITFTKEILTLITGG